MERFLILDDMVIRASAVNVMLIDPKNPTALTFDVAGSRQLYTINWQSEEHCRKQFRRAWDIIRGGDAKESNETVSTNSEETV